MGELRFHLYLVFLGGGGGRGASFHFLVYFHSFFLLGFFVIVHYQSRFSSLGLPLFPSHVRMSQIASRIDHVPHQLLHLFCLGEPALGLARKQQLIVEPDFECARGILDGLDGHFLELILKSREKLLRQPRSPQHPPAADTVRYLDTVVSWWQGEFYTWF